MNYLQFGTLKGFIPPVSDSLLSPSFIGSLVKNSLTFGIHAATKNWGQSYHLYELEKEHALLVKKCTTLEKHWKIIEKRLSHLMDEVLDWESETDGEAADFEELDNKVQNILNEKDELDQQAVVLKDESSLQRMSRTLFMVFATLGQLPADLFSLGFQGCYQSYLCEQRIKVLKAQNDYIAKQFVAFKDERDEFSQKNMDLLRKGMECKRDFIGVQHTDPAKAYLEVSKWKQELQNLQGQFQDLQKQFDQLDIQYKAAKVAEGKLVTMTQVVTDMTREKQTMQHQISQLQDEQKELNTLREQMQRMRRQSDRVQGLDQSLQNQLARLGPLTPKYKPEQAELVALEKEEEKDTDFLTAYQKRYEGLNMAPAVFKNGFAYALSEIFDMAEQDKDKIKLNRALGTPTSKGAHVVYRFLALDMLKGGKVIPTCHGYELKLNEEGVKLIPSLPENVLKSREVDGKWRQTIAIHFHGRDDFTPGEDELIHTSAACGIDPIAAKCLLAKLSVEEQKHFFNILLEPAMENDHPDYLAAVDFIGKQPKKQQELIYTLRNLISDIAVAMEIKFKNDIAMSEWQHYLDVEDFDLQPFVKKEETFASDVIAEDVFDDGQLFPWQVDLNILGAAPKSGVPQQPEFIELILNAKEKQQIYFSNLHKDMLLYPMEKEKNPKSVTWDLLKRQNYKSHQLIGSQGCLFSNLLAVLMVDEGDLTEENIKKLKKAMATYLDNVDLAKEFEGALKSELNCTVREFQNWLKGNNNRLDGKNLPPVVLQIAAFTLGVRIAFFSPPANSYDHARTIVEADEYGRLMPVEHIEGHYFGPPTQEVFMMAVENDYTYYGLFPKLDLAKFSKGKINIDPRDLATIKELENYWIEIQE